MFSPMPDLHREQRPEQRAGDRAERRADAEHDREQARDVDAHRGRHLAVRRAGAHQRAHPRLLHQQRTAATASATPTREDQQPVRRVAAVPAAARPGRRARPGADSGRSLPKTILTPSLRIRIRAKVASTCDRWSRAYSVRSSADLEQPCRTAAVSATAPNDAEHERAGQRDQPRGEERADHVERAVREVDHVHDAEHQRQPGGEQEQHQAELQPVERACSTTRRLGHCLVVRCRHARGARHCARRLRAVHWLAEARP